MGIFVNVKKNALSIFNVTLISPNYYIAKLLQKTNIFVLMRKAGFLIIPLLILLLLLINFRFSFFATYIKMQKTEFRAALLEKSNQKIIHLQIAKSNLYKNHFLHSGKFAEWKENNKELVIDGMFHEVVSVVIVNDTAHLALIEDKAENSLFQKYISSKNIYSKDNNNFIPHVFNFNYLLNETNFSFQYPKDIDLADNSGNTSIFKITPSPIFKPPIHLV